MKAISVVTIGSATVFACALAFGVAVAPVGAQQTRPMSDSDRRQQEQLQSDVKRLNADGAAAAVTPDGRRKVSGTIAKQFKVDPSVVEGLRNRRLGYGEITIALALSQALMKQNSSLTQQQALDTILARRASGEGWGQIAQSMGTKLGRLLSEVKTADKHVDDLKPKTARVDTDKPAKPDKPEKPEKPERPEKPGR